MHVVSDGTVIRELVALGNSVQIWVEHDVIAGYPVDRSHNVTLMSINSL